MEADMQGSTCSLAAFTERFRGTCDAMIMQSISDRNQHAQAVSLVLDYANQRITALERSSGASTSAEPGPDEKDEFWNAALPHLPSLFSLQVSQCKPAAYSNAFLLGRAGL